MKCQFTALGESYYNVATYVRTMKQKCYTILLYCIKLYYTFKFNAIPHASILKNVMPHSYIRMLQIYNVAIQQYSAATGCNRVTKHSRHPYLYISYITKLVLYVSKYMFHGTYTYVVCIVLLCALLPIKYFNRYVCTFRNSDLNNTEKLYQKNIHSVPEIVF